MVVLDVQRLTKFYRNYWTYRRILVLRDLSFCLEEGEVFGLVGPNGAGKTTTFKLLVGLLRPAEGTIRFCGKPVTTAARRQMGFLPEQPYFYDHLTVEETLDFYGRLHGMKTQARRNRSNEMIERLGLESKRRSRISTLSKGTLQRVGIAQAVISSPRLLILDEPMSGLDPIGRRHMRNFIVDLRNGGTTVIFSSHILPDTETLCDRVGILNLGTIREVVDLRHKAEPGSYVLVFSKLPVGSMPQLGQIVSQPIDSDGHLSSIRLADANAVRVAIHVIQDAGGVIESLTPIRSSLEERFLTVVGKPAGLD